MKLVLFDEELVLKLAGYLEKGETWQDGNHRQQCRARSNVAKLPWRRRCFVLYILGTRLIGLTPEGHQVENHRTHWNENARKKKRDRAEKLRDDKEQQGSGAVDDNQPPIGACLAGIGPEPAPSRSTSSRPACDG